MSHVTRVTDAEQHAAERGERAAADPRVEDHAVHVDARCLGEVLDVGHRAQRHAQPRLLQDQRDAEEHDAHTAP